MLKPSLQLKLGQTLTMTPQLQQAIRLLQLPVLDINAQIQEALEENIMLEMEDLPDVPRTSAESTAEVETIKADEAWQTRAAERIQDSGWNGEGRPITDRSATVEAPERAITRCTSLIRAGRSVKKVCTSASMRLPA